VNWANLGIQIFVPPIVAFFRQEVNSTSPKQEWKSSVFKIAPAMVLPIKLPKPELSKAMEVSNEVRLLKNRI
jgi:hypothetical protein